MTANIKKISELRPFYVLLLPVFFVLHSYVQYYGLASAHTAWQLLIKIEIIFIVCFLLLMAFSRNVNRNAMIMLLIGFFILFFGALKDFFTITLHMSFAGRYLIFLPLMTIVTLLAIRSIVRKKKFNKSNLFLNTLLLLFLFTEAVLMFIRTTDIYLRHNRLVKNDVIDVNNLPAVTERPDVYYLVFDSYPGSAFLQKYLQYNNSVLDSFLRGKGFYVMGHPKSNYNRTAFSMASALNAEYLQNIPQNTTLEPGHYNQASLSIEHSIVPNVFIRYGYKLYNLSVFDLPGHPSMFKENFLVLPEQQMLLYSTLIERFRRDVLWNFSWLLNSKSDTTIIALLQHQQIFTEDNIKKRDFNNRLIDSLPNISLIRDSVPKFVYAHFYLPHPPFFYDKNGKSLSLNIKDVVQSMEDRDRFISYLEYTNSVIMKTVDAILKNSSNVPVIIIQSDHGYRDLRQDVVHPSEYFKNYSAFYFPDKDYKTLYDSMTNINTFPVLFNKYFKTGITLQKDSTVFTVY